MSDSIRRLISTAYRILGVLSLVAAMRSYIGEDYDRATAEACIACCFYLVGSERSREP